MIPARIASVDQWEAKARFAVLRPVCYQDFPDALLPTALQQANPDAIARLVDGVITQP